MRILIVSDTHGKLDNLKKAIRKSSPFDLLIHCGDVEGQEDRIRELAGCPVKIVAGNNDFFCDLNREEEFLIGSHRVMLTHGHYYYVSLDPARLVEEASSRGVEIVMYGHTHRPVLEKIHGVMAVNPGSLSYPRQEGRRPSYILMELDQNDETHYTVIYL